MYDAMEIVSKKTEQDPIEVLDLAIRNVGPVMEVRPRRVGGATYQVPMEVPSDRRLTLAMRWINRCRPRPQWKIFRRKTICGIHGCICKSGCVSVKKREETHKMAEANRAFSHYRF